MTKLLGAVLILACCGIAGQWAVQRLKGRVRFLVGLQQGLLTLEKEISYSSTAMSQALGRAAETAESAGPLFQKAAELLRQGDGLTAGEAWERAVSVQGPLDAELLELLRLPGSGLGLSDSESQVKQLELCRERLREAERQAASREQQYGKVYQALSWGCGAVLVLFLL